MLSRRAFLGNLALATTGAVLAACAPQATPAPSGDQPAATQAPATSAPAEEEPTLAPEAPPDQKWALTWWTFPIGLPEAEWPHGKWEGELCARYTEEVDPNVTIEVTPLGWESWEKASTAIGAGTPPNLLGRSYDWFTEYAILSSDCAVEVELEEDLWNDLPEGYDEALLWRGKIYSLPWYVMAQGPLLNLSVVQEAGAEDLLPEPTCRSWDLDQFVELMKACTFTRSDGAPVFGTVIPTAYSTTAFVWPILVLLWNAGSDTMSFDESKGWSHPIREEAGIAWLKFMQDLYTVHGVCPDPRGLDGSRVGDYFSARSSAFHLPGPSISAARGADVTTDPETLTITTAEGNDIWFVQNPTAPGVPHTTWGGPKMDVNLQPFNTGETGAIPPTIAFAHWIVNRENQEWLSQYLIPVRSSAVELASGDPFLQYIFNCWVPNARVTSMYCETQDRDIATEMMQLLYLPTPPEQVAEEWAARLEGLDCYDSVV